MREIRTRNRMSLKNLGNNLAREGIYEKLERLKINPRTEIGAHPCYFF